LPVIAPERAVGAPLSGEKGTAERVPERVFETVLEALLEGVPVKMPVIDLAEFTLPCTESVTVVVAPVLVGAG
jgi:hypothetical protein